VKSFKLALELEPSAPLLFNLGQSVAKLGRLSEAKKYLEEARDLAAKSGPESIVKLASSALVELEARMPRVTVVLPGAAKGARVDLDGAPFDLTADGSVVEPGQHELSVVADGYQPHRESFSLKEGERRSIQPRLERIQKATVEAAPQVEKKPSLLGPVILGGAGVVALGAATYFYFQVKSTDEERRGLWGSSGCPGPSCPNGEPARAAELRKDAESQALLGNVLLGVGAAAVVAGGAWYFLSKKSSEPAAGSGLYVVPAPGGAIVGGRL
jgi:hypothetical protein